MERCIKCGWRCRGCFCALCTMKAEKARLQIAEERVAQHVARRFTARWVLKGGELQYTDRLRCRPRRLPHPAIFLI